MQTKAQTSDFLAPRLPGFAIAECIHAGRRSLVYRAHRRADGGAVILKCPVARPASESDSERLSHELEFSARAEAGDVQRALGLERSVDGTPVLILEDAGGQLLSSMIKGRAARLLSLLRLSIRLTDLIARLHAREIIHADIKPANVLVNLDTGAVKLLDLADSIRRGPGSQAAPQGPLGSPAYRAPELFRTARAPDERSDFYSLGVLLYEVATGRTPFPTEDPIELEHCHLAVQAAAPHTINSEIPESLSAILLKLLAKNPDERYQSAFGLKSDLQRCLAHLRNDGAVPRFEPGKSDVSGQLALPRKLFGRDAEVEALLDAYRAIQHGGVRLYLVKGVTGIGKSSLVSEIRQQVSDSGGFFVSSAYEAVSRDSPLSGIVRAFRQFIRELATLDDAAADAWRKRLRTVLGPNGKIISDLIPEVEFFLGKQEEPLELPAEEARNRFQTVFRSFVRGFASSAHPLALFLDDLHWADPASLSLLAVLLTDPDTSHLLLICAFREDNGDPFQGMQELLARLKQEGFTASGELPLGPLAASDVKNLLAETFGAPEGETADLANLVHARTGGNPFYIVEFLKTLVQERLIFFDTANGRWTWILDQIVAHPVSANVADLLAWKLKGLPRNSREALELAACMGASFDLHNLSVVLQQTELETAEALALPIQLGVLTPAGDDPDFVAPGAADDHPLLQVRFCFSHDRIQQAAYMLLEQDRRSLAHWIVGLHLLRTLPPARRDERIIEIANHLQNGSDLAATPEQNLELARVNLQAARRAKRSAAFAAAQKHILRGMEQLPEDAWNSEYALTLALHTEAVELEFLSGKIENADALASAVINRARSLLDQAPIYNFRIKAYNGAGRMRDALNTGLELLRRLGLKLPARAGQLSIGIAYLRLQGALRTRRIESLPDMPLIQDAEADAAIRTCMRTAVTAYITSPGHLPLLTFEAVRLSLKHGNSLVSPHAYAACGLILSAAFGKLERGYALGQASIAVAERLNATESRHRAMGIMEAFLRHTKEPVLAARDNFDLGARLSLEAGDLEFFSAYRAHYLCYRALSGESLLALRADYRREEGALHGYQQQQWSDLYFIAAQSALNLIEDSGDVCALEGPAFSEKLRLPEILDRSIFVSAYYLYCFKAWLALLFRRETEARAFVNEAQKYAASALGSFARPRLDFFLGLLDARRAARGDRAALNDARRASNALAALVKFEATNHGAALALLNAEIEIANGRPEKATSLFDQAIRMARESQNSADEALACELAGEYYATQRRDRVAGVYFLEAVQAYRRWGAEQKVEDVENRQRNYLRMVKPIKMESSTSGDLDMEAVVRTTRILSREIELQGLVERLMEFLVQYAGAQRGVLVLARSDRLVVEAVHDPAADIHQTACNLPISDETLPVSVLQYSRRTGEAVVLDRASSEGLFTRCPYVLRRRPKSALCLPIVNHGRIIGYLYLENNLYSGAFTPDKVQLINIMAAQAAVSLENADLYARQQGLLNAFGRFVPVQFLNALRKTDIAEIRRGDSVEREVTVLFMDVRGFTSLSEKLNPSEAAAYLNDLLEYIAAPIGANRGFIDKYIGDAVLALFPENPADAVATAIQMLRALEKWNSGNRNPDGRPAAIGIGIHTGHSVFATIGVGDRLSTTVLGDTVNMAARLESATKKYGVPLLISETTRDRLGHSSSFHWREIDRVRLRGKTKATTLYESFDHESPERVLSKRRVLPDYEQGLEDYRKGGFADALQRFQIVRTELGEDVATRMYIKRCIHWLANPPEADWDPVTDLHSK